MTQAEQLQALAERFAAKAKSAAKTECSAEYQAYWRGYSAAFEEAGEMLRAQASGERA